MAEQTLSKTPGPEVFLELRKTLQSGLLIIRKDVAQCPADVQVTGRDSSLCIQTPRGDLTLTLPAEVTLEEGSCVPTPAGEASSEELHFRLRISSGENTDQEPPDSMMETLRAKETYCFHCQGCTTRLLEDRVFKRVLPLPNGNWNTIVDDWCCHPDPFNKKLLPRAEDCLMGDTFVLVTKDRSCKETLTEEVSPVGAEDPQDPKKTCRRLLLASCASCSLVLGEVVSPETLKLYITQVVVEPAVGDRKPEVLLNRSVFVERTIAARLQNLSNTLSSFRFSVQTPDGKTTLLLWLLNSDSIVASVSEACISEERSTSSALHGSSHAAAPALKVLYISCSDPSTQQKEIALIWDANATGHPVVLPLKVCEEMLQVLQASNSGLPGSMRYMRCYEVAYLKL
ncbi:E3 ubiquitin-protein ligase E3D [Gouania willdenowi]|uniref:E3 ubiquitin-protein ligase E3D n=1 Tax=Gouania willdenowi TaxID=441366 RepID=A0A8C5G571_GOUWI|nr:E3 ubiquitin-protein ligase E3D [Gouania willdenowi]